MKKKVGIVTIHYVDNLGGVLLTYALQETIEKRGYAVTIINFDPTVLASIPSLFARTIAHRAKRLPEYLLHLRDYVTILRTDGGVIFPSRHVHRSSGLRKDRFDAFRARYIKLSEAQYSSSGSLEEWPPVFDAYVCGSDQIWNPFICKSAGRPKNERAYFLTFAPESKRISYAASIAIPTIPQQLRPEFSSLIRGIRYLSTRERQGAELIRDVAGRDAEVVLDPTLLLTPDDWRRVAVSPTIAKPYVLCYFLGEGRAYREFAEELKRRTGFRLVVISSKARDLGGTNDIVVSNVGPSEFLGIVKNAECVCTDSFHGTAFSINFEKPFYAFERPTSGGVQSTASRLFSILELFELKSRFIQHDTPFPANPMQIDYSVPRILLQRNRERSLRYLENALLEVTSR